MSKPNSYAVILARVSSKSQEDEGYSLDSQLKLLEHYCESKELIIKRVFRIAETASKDQSRRVFHELLAYIKKNNINHLTVEKTDRLTRNLRDAVAIDDWLQGDPARMLHAVKENLLLHKEARSDVKFMWNIHLAVAKKYTDNLREEAMKGWAEKLAQGWMPAPPPPGYMTIIENGKRIHVPDPKTAQIIQDAFKLYLEDGQSSNSITMYLGERGVTSRFGNAMAKSYVHRMLSNPFYVGVIRFNGRDYPGAQEPLLTNKLFEAVQLKLTGGHQIRRRVHTVTLKGLVRCTFCNGMISWQLQKGHYYGNCQRDLESCKTRKYIREDLLEKVLVEQLDKLICPSHEIIDWVVDLLTEKKSDIEDDKTAQEQTMRQRIKRLEAMDETLYEDKLAGEITAEKYTQKHGEFQEELRTLRDKLSSLDESISDDLDDQITIIQLTQRASVDYREGDIEKRREILGRLIESIEVDAKYLTIKLRRLTAIIGDKSLKSRELLSNLAKETS